MTNYYESQTFHTDFFHLDRIQLRSDWKGMTINAHVTLRILAEIYECSLSWLIAKMHFIKSLPGKDEITTN